jgi:hypothetical protein
MDPSVCAPRREVVTTWSLAGVLCLSLALTSCSGGDSTEPKQRRLDSARLAELDLTYKIPAQVQQACSEAGRLARVRVVCPGLIPDVPLTRSAGLWGAIVARDDPRFYMLTFNNGGLPGGRRHWITGGGNTAVVKKWVLTDFQNVVEGDARLVRTLERMGRLVSIYHFPPYPAGGPNGGHWAAFIDVGDEVVFASPHERRYVEAAVEMALALAEDFDGAAS